MVIFLIFLLKTFDPKASFEHPFRKFYNRSAFVSAESESSEILGQSPARSSGCLNARTKVSLSKGDAVGTDETASFLRFS